MAKRIISALIPFSFFLITFSASAAIPVRWTVDTFRVKPLVYDCYHGETLDLAAAMTAYGEPLDLHGKTARLYWQTNGMEQTYWSTNATITTSQTSQTPQTSQTTNVLQATFVGSFDPGAPSVNGFIGVEGENYRAAFTLNFRPSPGFTPAHISPPVKVLDFATTQVANPEASPFMVKGGAGGIDAATAGTIATNTVNAKVAPWAMNGQPKPSGGADTNAVNDLIRSYDTTNLTARIAAKQDKLPYLTNAIPAGVIANAPWLTASATNGLRRLDDFTVNLTIPRKPWKMMLEGSTIRTFTFMYENSNEIYWKDLEHDYNNGYVKYGKNTSKWEARDNSMYGSVSTNAPIDLLSFVYYDLGYREIVMVRDDASGGTVNDRLATTNGVNAAYVPKNGDSTIDGQVDIKGGIRFGHNYVGIFRSSADDTMWLETPDKYFVFSNAYSHDNSVLTPDSSDIATSNMVERISTNVVKHAISGRTYDFDGGSNFVKRVYAALTNVIQALGGSITNAPAFN